MLPRNVLHITRVALYQSNLRNSPPPSATASSNPDSDAQIPIHLPFPHSRPMSRPSSLPLVARCWRKATSGGYG